MKITDRLGKLQTFWILKSQIIPAYLNKIKIFKKNGNVRKKIKIRFSLFNKTVIISISTKWINAPYGA